MILGTGIDVTETARIEKALARHGGRFSGRIYTAEEIRYCEKFKNRAERYAARFAAKKQPLKRWVPAGAEASSGSMRKCRIGRAESPNWCCMEPRVKGPSS